MSIPFVPRIDGAPYAQCENVAPLVQRVIAQNPSKFTYHGTGTYILGTNNVVVIDPGPILDTHRDALWSALQGRKVVGIVVTHCHSDHSPLAQWLHSETGAPRYAIGPHRVYDDFVEEDENLSPKSKYGYGDILYWLKYCSFATLAGLTVQWPAGLIVPVVVPFPVVYIPIKPIQTNYGFIVVGLSICGLYIFPWVLFVNYSSNFALKDGLYNFLIASLSICLILSLVTLYFFPISSNVEFLLDSIPNLNFNISCSFSFNLNNIL
jgi:hypothetical protein